MSLLTLAAIGIAIIALGVLVVAWLAVNDKRRFDK